MGGDGGYEESVENDVKSINYVSDNEELIEVRKRLKAGKQKEVNEPNDENESNEHIDVYVPSKPNLNEHINAYVPSKPNPNIFVGYDTDYPDSSD